MIRKRKSVLPPIEIAEVANALVRTGCVNDMVPTIAETLFDVEAWAVAPNCWVLAAKLDITVPAAGICPNEVLAKNTARTNRTSLYNLAFCEVI